ncbi:MAG: AMP-binding protein, partial [Alphaproteobacteria bacterium]
MDHLGEGQLGWFFWRALEEHQDKTAVIDISQSVTREISFQALDAAINRVANTLVTAGLKPGDRIGLGMTNRYEFLAAMFGAMRAGAVPVPMNIKQGDDIL